MMGIKVVRIPRRITDDEIYLRLSRLTDLPALYKLFQEAILVKSHPLDVVPASLWSFRQWIGRNFQVLYLIHLEVDRKPITKGFIGLYDIRLGNDLCVAIGVFDPHDRGRGIGSDALRLLLQAIKACGAANVVKAEVVPSNSVSLHMFDRLGFAVSSRSKDRVVLQKALQ